jgi:ABC-type Mn2+/Zn2+ transport system permease subunit
MPYSTTSHPANEDDRAMARIPVSVRLWRRMAVGVTLLGLGCALVSLFLPWAYAQAALGSPFEGGMTLDRQSDELSRMGDSVLIYVAFGVLVALSLVMVTRRPRLRRAAGIAALVAGIFGVVSSLYATRAVVLKDMDTNHPFHAGDGLSITYASGVWWGVTAMLLLSVGVAALGRVDRAPIRLEDDASRLSRVSGYRD